MPDQKKQEAPRRIHMRYRGHLGQARIFLVKMLRLFVFQKDWVVLPMATLVAGLVGFVIRDRFFYSMEGSLVSALALACVCIWNGCFNSIQVICRERDVIKREHRSGLHISSYILAHMLYQAMLCMIQTVITVYITWAVGVQYPSEGLITPFYLLDFSVSIFLITYAADMMSLWISSMCHTTTLAMTVMPMVLILQLVFSGGMMSLPAQLKPVTELIICNQGLKLITAQADYNSQPFASVWNTLFSVRYNEFTTKVTFGQVLDYLNNADDATAREIRKLGIGDLESYLKDNADLDISFDEIAEEITGQKLAREKLTIGDLTEKLSTDPSAEELRAQVITITFTPDQLIRMAGEDDARNYILDMTSEAAKRAEYDYTVENITGYWLKMIVFSLGFAFLAMIILEFIDRDKR